MKLEDYLRLLIASRPDLKTEGFLATALADLYLDPKGLKEGLEGLREDGPYFLNSGICTNWWWFMGDSKSSFGPEGIEAIVMILSLNWPHHSGNVFNPVEGGVSWKRYENSGELRWGLLDHLIGHMNMIVTLTEVENNTTLPYYWVEL